MSKRGMQTQRVVSFDLKTDAPSLGGRMLSLFCLLLAHPAEENVHLHARTCGCRLLLHSVIGYSLASRFHANAASQTTKVRKTFD